MFQYNAVFLKHIPEYFAKSVDVKVVRRNEVILQNRGKSRGWWISSELYINAKCYKLSLLYTKCSLKITLYDKCWLLDRIRRPNKMHKLAIMQKPWKYNTVNTAGLRGVFLGLETSGQATNLGLGRSINGKLGFSTYWNLKITSRNRLVSKSIFFGYLVKDKDCRSTTMTRKAG